MAKATAPADVQRLVERLEQTDALVYELHGLADAEIRTVESTS
jgi:hypothetical protein